MLPKNIVGDPTAGRGPVRQRGRRPRRPPGPRLGRGDRRPLRGPRTPGAGPRRRSGGGPPDRWACGLCPTPHPCPTPTWGTGETNTPPPPRALGLDKGGDKDKVGFPGCGGVHTRRSLSVDPRSSWQSPNVVNNIIIKKSVQPDGFLG